MDSFLAAELKRTGNGVEKQKQSHCLGAAFFIVQQGRGHVWPIRAGKAWLAVTKKLVLKFRGWEASFLKRSC